MNKKHVIVVSFGLFLLEKNDRMNSRISAYNLGIAAKVKKMLFRFWLIKKKLEVDYGCHLYRG